MKLTTASVAALAMPIGKSDHITWDADLPGFGVRLRGDRKSYVVQYRIGGGTRRESLGDTRKVKLEDARKIARARFAQVELGVDPTAAKAQARVASTAASLRPWGASAERYLAPVTAPKAACDRRPTLPPSAISVCIGGRCAIDRSAASAAPRSQRGCRRSLQRTVACRLPGRGLIYRRCLPLEPCGRGCAIPIR